MFYLSRILRHLIKRGTLTVIDHRGRRFRFAGSDGPRVTMRVHSRWAAWRIALTHSLGVGEAYMDGLLTIEEGGTLRDLLVLFGINIGSVGNHPFHKFLERSAKLVRRLHQFNRAKAARRRVAHHYDLSGRLYDLFLDADKQYSCAYFETGTESLEQAQLAKKRLIAAKLLLKPGHKVLDIGSGWGGLGFYLAQTAQVEVEGITLSREQLDLSNKRAEEAGLANRVAFHLRDYREQQGIFDRVVSVGMFEHVGVGYFTQYFEKIHDLLSEDGVALLHTIGRSTGPNVTDRWLRKYIFPGGYIPALSEIVPAIEKAGLVITDIQVLGPHYAKTLQIWLDRFKANWDRVAEIYDERFCRMWEFYLAGSEASFREIGLTVFQIQLARRGDNVPLTRDYISSFEQSHAAAEYKGNEWAA